MAGSNVLITNLFLRGVSGTESHTRDLAIALAFRGCNVAVFTPDRLGPLAGQMRSVGVAVVRDPREVPFQPDVLHGNHNFALAIAMQAFPETPAIFVCHDATAWHDRAPKLPQVVRYFAVDELCRQRVCADLGLPSEDISIVGNSVDLGRFRARLSFPRQAQRAMIMNHLACETNFVPTIRAACEQQGIELTVFGAYSDNVTLTPELELLRNDIVFAKGRSAMEALACGCHVVLCGLEGIGPPITLENFQFLRSWNFGRKLLEFQHSPELIAARIAQFDPDLNQAVSILARRELGLPQMIDTWLEHYKSLPRTLAIDRNDRSWVDELQHLYQQLDRLHTLEYQLNLSAQH
jgi:hypothetical protein